MRLTRQTNYALRILMYCGANPGRSRIPDIARAYGLSEAFLFKVLQPLVEYGLITTTRGRSGGIALARPAGQISILDVVKVTEGSFAMAECFEDEHADCPLIDHCGLNSVLRDALNAFFTVLAERNIADLVASRPDLAAVLSLEQVHGAPGAH
ncbi:MAG: Rrf2 family transcriptional regulator [Alphaproteobacteria bacterium]|nr:MAG: Rrf2 family transcriptional regulator [Alphaproteobacteria bacterium]